MKTFIFHSNTSGGYVTVVINATDKKQAKKIAEKHPHVWRNYTMHKVNESQTGVVFDSVNHQ